MSNTVSPGAVSPGAPSPFPSLANFRDLGHWVGDEGRTVVPGTLYRANDFALIDDADHAGLAGLGLRSVVDLRTAVERESTPDPAFPGADEVVLDVLADSTRIAIPANMHKILGDPTVVHQMSAQLSPDKARALMADNYRDLVALDSAKTAMRTFYKGLLSGELTPTLFHCTTGKDRTGWAAATFLSLMGVDRADVYRDYLLTNERLLPSLEPVFARFADAGGDRQLLIPLLGVDETYLDTAFAQMREDYGTLEHYFDEALDVDADAQAALRERYLVAAP